MVALGFLRVLDSEMLLLLATTNTLLVQRAEAASPALAVDDVVCQSEVEACNDSGDSCRTCLGVDDTVKTELAVFCAEGLDSEDSDSSEVTCDSVRSQFCCLDVMTPESACRRRVCRVRPLFSRVLGLLGGLDRARYVEDAGKGHYGGGTAANLEYRLGCCCVKFVQGVRSLAEAPVRLIWARQKIHASMGVHRIWTGATVGRVA